MSQKMSDTPITDQYRGIWATTAVNKKFIYQVAQEFERRIAELEQERDAWIESARQFSAALSCGAEYYRGFVVKIGELLGPAAYVSDDGSVQKDVLCAKVPELVAKLVRERDLLKQIVDAGGTTFICCDYPEVGYHEPDCPVVLLEEFYKEANVTQASRSPNRRKK